MRDFGRMEIGGNQRKSRNGKKRGQFIYTKLFYFLFALFALFFNNTKLFDISSEFSESSLTSNVQLNAITAFVTFYSD